MHGHVKAAGPRILLYSHDTVGLGHLRRNQAIACCLARSFANPSILVVSGSRECTLFDTPRCVNVVTIPGLKKSRDGAYVARHEGLSIADAVGLRSTIIRSVVEQFRPDVFVVDKVPLGVYGELEPALQWIRDTGHARCVLGLRDILDDAAAVRREWMSLQGNQAVAAYYDAVWIYGDRRVCDVEGEYGIPLNQLAEVSYTGYIDRSIYSAACFSPDDRELPEDAIPAEKFVLCLVGGGEDGARLATTFAGAAFPQGTRGVVITGPYMPARYIRRLHRLAARRSDLHVRDFVSHPEDLIERCDRVVAMGGYNTVCEILARRKPALIIPRVTPRTEQLIRAQRMSALGLFDMLHPNRLDASTLSQWLCEPAVEPPEAQREISLKGLTNIPRLVTHLLDDRITSPVVSGETVCNHCPVVVGSSK